MPYAAYHWTNDVPAAWVAFYDESNPGSQVAQQIERLRRQDEPVRITALDASTLRIAAAAGIGKALLPVCLGDGDPQLERAAGLEDFDRALHVHIHPDTIGTARVQLLLAWLREHFARLFEAG